MIGLEGRWRAQLLSHRGKLATDRYRRHSCPWWPVNPRPSARSCWLASHAYERGDGACQALRSPDGPIQGSALLKEARKGQIRLYQAHSRKHPLDTGRDSEGMRSIHAASHHKGPTTAETGHPFWSSIDAQQKCHHRRPGPPAGCSRGPPRVCPCRFLGHFRTRWILV
jgi:hypothetical protein